MSRSAAALKTPKPATPAAAPGIPETLPQQYLATELELERHARAAGDEGGAEEEVITVTISTETPHKRRFGIEILEHTKSAIDWSLAKQGLALLLEHGGDFDPYFGTAGRVLPGHHLGMVHNIRLEGEKLKGDCYFEEHEEAQRVKRGILATPPTRRYVSCGWQPILAKQTKVAKEPDQHNEYRWVKWKPVEVSFVSIPADPNAGLSARSGGGAEYPVTVEGATPAQEEKDMLRNLNPKMDGEPAGGGTQARGGAPVADPPAPSASVEVDPKAFAKRAGEIMRACRASNAEQLAEGMISRGLTLEQAKAELFDHRAKASGIETLTAPPSPEDIVSRMNAKERKEYSYVRALGVGLDLYQNREARGLEFEIHQELAKTGAQQKTGSVMVPLSLMPFDNDKRQVRALGTGVSGGGAELIYDQRGQMIELLRESSIIGRLGGNVLPGLSQPIRWPRATSDPEWYWMGENPPSPVTASQPGFDTVQMIGRTGMASVPIPKQLIIQAVLDMENYVKARLGFGAGLFIDRGGFRGTGGQNQPLGLLSTPGIQTLDINGVPDWQDTIAATTKVAKQNAPWRVLGWAATTDLAGVWMGKLKDSVAGAQYMWEGTHEEGKLGAYRAASSTMLPTDLDANGISAPGSGTYHTALFGKWDEVNIGLFGAMELTVDPFTLMDYGQLKVGAFLMADVVVARPQLFVLLLRATLS